MNTPRTFIAVLLTASNARIKRFSVYEPSGAAGTPIAVWPTFKRHERTGRSVVERMPSGMTYSGRSNLPAYHFRSDATLRTALQEVADALASYYECDVTLHLLYTLGITTVSAEAPAGSAAR